MGGCYLAIDIGASSGRHILGRLEHGRLALEEIYRFENRQVRRGGHDCWDPDALWQGVLEGLKECGRRRVYPASVGIDTWAVDFALLDGDDRLIGDLVSYRDGRTAGADVLVEQRISASRLYARTGIQKQPFNTIYQLAALQAQAPDQLARAASLLMIPDYLNFRLTGIKKQEYTNATTTGLVNARARDWDRPLLEELGLPQKLFGPLSPPGTVVGPLLAPLAEEVGFQTLVVLPATHDTGSAFLAAPARDEQAVTLSSGTWSLLGVETVEPVTTEASRLANFTNEGGAWYRFRYLKNIMGLWMIQSIRRELNGVGYVAGRETAPWSLDTTAGARHWSFAMLADVARAAGDFPSLVDVNDGRFLAPGSMIAEVQAACATAGQPVPRTTGQLMQCVYQSLARCYRDAVRELSALTGRTCTSLNILGGGCQDTYLNELTARSTGLAVLAGPVEGTAVGNLAVQMIRAGELPDLRAARAVIARSFSIKEVTP